MKKKNLAHHIASILDELFPAPEIPLLHKDPYTLLIAVLLSAQCTDARVNLITPKLFEKADAPEKMMTLSFETVESIIRPCGLSRTKAKAILSLSKDLVEKHQGKVPQTFEDLEALQGVGHKTASVVMVQAFQSPAFPVDTHIHRCAKRWRLSNGKSVAQTEKDLKQLFPKKKWAILHLQIIYYARSYCPAKRHEVETCPICHFIKSSSNS